MKKLLVLLLVFGMASVANAGPISLSVNGDPADAEITLGVSDTITLDIIMDAAEFAGGDIAIVISNPQGALDYSGITFATSVMTRRYNDFDEVWVDGMRNWEAQWSVSPLSDPQYLKITGGNLNWNTLGSYVLMDNVIFHCEEATEVIIDLVAITDLMYWQFDSTGTKLADYAIVAAEGTLLDSINVTQIPEPMTIILLGLGGLFLRRRK